MTGLVLVGASGLAREASAVAVLLRHEGPLSIVDDDPARWGTLHGLTPVLGAVDLLTESVDHDVVLALGKGRHRRRVATRLELVGFDPDRYTSIVHPRVVLPGSCHVDAGAIVLDGVVLTADVEVGRHVVLMPQVTLTHGCTVHDFATLCAGVTLGGDVEVGEAAYIGMNASVREGVRIGAGATLGMGSVLLEDLPPGETWVGVPARPIRIGVHT
ncbi:sugar O-acyltransferase (sialic acid O-acetyltransferase NeuD family) [Nocardioides cavernae]|uniref:Sugar O-acyltransferase (Sialic acid O-acetyltransferase NeuD family) n=1 Tax=Nocardioides cavernae TaxID=1921566 RepID=A0A7Y9KRN7_9ACTN|nr:NeuD/PglB/VioB family sugar acetyltransferase [Nocardioides cavernae]NYE35532.1 sugar O-acyltransferase (sialic acid O-acetyltransferase NeuD family) [Nocardioides cavernae]